MVAKIVVLKELLFDGVKDMMKFYFFDGDFPYSRLRFQKFKLATFIHWIVLMQKVLFM